MATVIIATDAREAFLELPLRIQQRMEKIFAKLEAEWPEVSGAKPLRGELAGCYRFRTGDYRIVLRASDRTVEAILTVFRIGHRKDVYDD